MRVLLPPERMAHVIFMFFNLTPFPFVRKGALRMRTRDMASGAAFPARGQGQMGFGDYALPLFFVFTLPTAQLS
jgi:hypothetical protein